MPGLLDEQLRRFEPPNAVRLLAHGRRHGGGVYRLRGRDSGLLYVGVGFNPALRIAVHAKSASWWPDVDLAQSEIEWFRNYGDAELAERIAIRLERPRHNMIHSGERPHWSHERGRSRKPPFFDESANLEPATVRSKIAEMVSTVRMHRRTVFVGLRHSPGVAVVPVELGQLAIRLGGADRAAAILLDHIRADQRSESR